MYNLHGYALFALPKKIYMKKTHQIISILLLTVTVMVPGLTMAQDPIVQDIQKKIPEDSTHKEGWKLGAALTLGLAQGGTSNWAAGGEKSSFSLNSHVNLFGNWKKGKNKWTNNLDLFYAVLRTTSDGVRKNDDMIDFYSKYIYSFKPKVGLGVVTTFRTQFTEGFDYDVTPPEKTSNFFAPAYLTIAPGADWAPAEDLSLFLSPLSARWTFVNEANIELAPDYGLDSGHTSLFQAGAYFSAIFKREIFKNVTYKGRLDLFSNYLDKPQNIDVYWTNLFGFKVNNWLTVTYSFDLIYDDNIRLFGPNENAPRTQTKTLLSIGFSGKL